MSIEDLRFVITGGAKGIGEATARLACARGAKVTIGDVDDDAGFRLATDLSSDGYSAQFVHADVRSDADVAALMEASEARFGGLDVLHNNAGVVDRAVSPTPTIDAATAEQFASILDLNLIGAWRCAKAAVPLLRRSDAASIINAASTSARIAYLGTTFYGASKAGLEALTRQLAVELAADRIRVNCYLPAVIDTPMHADLLLAPEVLAASVGGHLIPRLGQAQEVASLVCFLASSEARFMSGGSYVIDGGTLAWNGRLSDIGLRPE